MIEEKDKASLRIAHPHDRLVKRLLSVPAIAKGVLSLYLPNDVLKITDLDKLSLQRDSFIDDEHRAFAADLLFKTSFQKEEGYIWILLEHQSTDDPWLPVRIFKYIGTIWEHLRKTTKSSKIPLIYPVVIYNGQRSYSHTLTLNEMIAPKDSQKLFKNLFTNPLCMIDLNTIQDEVLRKQLQKNVRGVALLMTLKHVFDKNLQNYFEQVLVDVFKQLDQSGNRDDVADMLYYLLNEGKFLNKIKFWNLLHQEFSPEIEDKVMTIAEQLKAEGREEGIEKGKLEVAKRLLEEGVELGFIVKVTKLPLAKIKELQKKSKH